MSRLTVYELNDGDPRPRLIEFTGRHRVTELTAGGYELNWVPGDDPDAAGLAWAGELIGWNGDTLTWGGQ
jgi:hypothetical protein